MKGLAFITFDGDRLPVTDLLDIDNEPTNDPALAFTAVLMMPCGHWRVTACEPGDFAPHGLH